MSKKKNILIINSINNVPSNRQYFLLSEKLSNENYNVIHVTDTSFFDDNFLGTILYWKNKKVFPTLFFFLKIVLKYRSFSFVILSFRAIPFSFLFSFFSDKIIITYQSDIFPKKNSFHKFKLSLKFFFCDKIVTVSNYMKDKIKSEFYFVKDKEVIVFKNSIETKKYSVFDKDYEKNKDTFLQKRKIIFVGNLEFHKGFDLLLNYFKCNRNSNIYLTIVGNGSLVDEIPKNNDRITYLGKLNHDAVLSEMSKNHFILIPSRSEAFGQVAIEAMLMKTIPVIANGTGAAEIVTKKTGFVFDEIKEAIDFIINCDLEEYKKLCKNISVEIEKFDTNKWINDYFELINSSN